MSYIYDDNGDFYEDSWYPDDDDGGDDFDDFDDDDDFDDGYYDEYQYQDYGYESEDTWFYEWHGHYSYDAPTLKQKVLWSLIDLKNWIVYKLKRYEDIPF